MFQDKPKDEGGVPHLNQVISCRRNMLLIRNRVILSTSSCYNLISISSFILSIPLPLTIPAPRALPPRELNLFYVYST